MNLHVLRHQILSLARLPIPPLALLTAVILPRVGRILYALARATSGKIAAILHYETLTLRKRFDMVATTLKIHQETFPKQPCLSHPPE